MKLGQRLRELRDKAGITQLALSIKAGCSKNYISALERGVNKLTVPMFLEYCKALHLTPNDILGFRAEDRLIEAESVLSSMTDKEYAQAVRVLHALKQK